MFALISASTGAVYLLLAFLAVVAAAYVIKQVFFFTTPISSKHKGKADTHKCKFDQEEVRRTRGLVPPPPVQLDLGPADERVKAALSSISIETLREKLLGLTGEKPVTVGGRVVSITSRNTYYKDLALSIEWLEAFYDGLGVAHRRVPYKIRGKTYYSLEAKFPGKGPSRKVVILGSHLDSTAGSPWSAERVAPGADDDASGTIAALLIAEKLVGMELECEVRILHFTGEEQGLYGSYVYSDEVAAQNLDVVMLQLDMIGYSNNNGNRMDIHDGANRNGSHELASLLIENVARYGLNLKAVDTHNRAMDDRSDHAGFLDHGYKALLVSEEFTDENFNPNYHSEKDRVTTLNLPFLLEVIRLILASVVDLAGLKTAAAQKQAA